MTSLAEHLSVSKKPLSCMQYRLMLTHLLNFRSFKPEAQSSSAAMLLYNRASLCFARMLKERCIIEEAAPSDRCPAELAQRWSWAWGHVVS